MKNFTIQQTIEPLILKYQLQSVDHAKIAFKSLTEATGEVIAARWGDCIGVMYNTAEGRTALFKVMYDARAHTVQESDWDNNELMNLIDN